MNRLQSTFSLLKLQQPKNISISHFYYSTSSSLSSLSLSPSLSPSSVALSENTSNTTNTTNTTTTKSTNELKIPTSPSASSSTSSPAHKHPSQYQFHNNNPRSAEMLGLAPREKGYNHLVYMSRQSENFTAYLKHANQDIILSASTREIPLKSQLYSTGNKSAAFHVGRLLAKRMLEAGILSAELDLSKTGSEYGRDSAFILGLRGSGVTIGEVSAVKQNEQLYKQEQQKQKQQQEPQQKQQQQQTPKNVKADAKVKGDSKKATTNNEVKENNKKDNNKKDNKKSNETEQQPKKSEE